MVRLLAQITFYRLRNSDIYDIPSNANKDEMKGTKKCTTTILLYKNVRGCTTFSSGYVYTPKYHSILFIPLKSIFVRKGMYVMI